MVEPIDSAEFEKRRARLGRIYEQIAVHAVEQARFRCPYKNRFDLCTARFGCRNQGPVDQEHGLLLCRSDDQLDYRGAWEVEDADAMLEVLRQGREPDRAATSGEPSSEVPAARCRPTVGRTLFEHADELGVQVASSCGRMGSCHECVVEVLVGADVLSPRSELEHFLVGRYRLACQARVVSEADEIAFSPPRRMSRILVDRPDSAPALAPAVRRRDQSVVRGEEVIDEYRGRILGLAVDVGTTTVVVEMIDLESGESLEVVGFENPQRFGGSDVISRIAYDVGESRGELRQSLSNALNSEIRGMCQRNDVSRHALYDLVIVGNATMRDLFFDLDVQSIGQKPYKSEVEREYLDGDRADTVLDVGARSLGVLANRNARVYGAPLIASHIGGDVAAGLLVVDLASFDGTTMMLDIGTNTEVVIRHGDRLVVASCPAGPAFEGGLVRFGMPACRGAIDHIRAVGDDWQFTTIDDAAPVGLCGSALVDVLAELLRTGRISPLGVFPDRRQAMSLVADPPISLSREDASHLAQAKAANYCGQFILLRSLGLTPGDIDRLYLAGGFAHYLDVEAAAAIGFLAPVDPDRVVKVGNAAIEGARQLLLDVGRRHDLLELIAGIEHVELETTPDFFEIFTDACRFEPMRLEE